MDKEDFMQAYVISRAGSGLQLTPQRVAASAARVYEAIKAEVEGRAEPIDQPEEPETQVH